jgi:hypothetical protein
MEPRLKLSKQRSNPPVDVMLYRNIVGSLRYLVQTRPDISFAIGMVSRFMEAPTTELSSTYSATSLGRWTLAAPTPQHRVELI